MIFIPSQFIIPFFVLMGAIILVCLIIMIVQKRKSSQEKSLVRVVSKRDEQIRGMAKGTTRNVTTFQRIDSGEEFDFTIPPGIHEFINPGDECLLYYTALKGKPAWFRAISRDGVMIGAMKGFKEEPNK